MDRHISVTLDDELGAFVDGQIAEGRYGDPDAVLRAGLRLLECEAAKLASLRAALVAGEESGSSTFFDFDAFIASRLIAEPPAP